MPYSIHKLGNEYAVVKNTDGRVLGKHPSHKKALRQIQAIYANEGRQKARGG